MQRIGSALMISLCASSAAADPPPTEPVRVDIVAANGAGCSAGRFLFAVAPDNTALHVLYTDILVQVGVGARPTDARKNCVLSLLVHPPPGFTYAISESDYFGFASMADGATGTLRTGQFFQGESPRPLVSHTLAGPLDGEWRFSDTADPTALRFAPCDAPATLNLQVDLRMAVGTSDPTRTNSLMNMDIPDVGGVPTVHRLVWKRCEPM